MRILLLVAAFTFGFIGLSGCSKKSEATTEQPPPEDSGADSKQVGKGARIPKGP
jgi:hypothetical protein